MLSPSPHAGLSVFLLLLVLLTSPPALAQARRPPAGGQLAIVVDERLSALRASPDLSGKLLQRVRRGRYVSIRRERKNGQLVFCFVKVTSRTSGWIQREALASRSLKGDDERLLRLIRASEGFDRLARARIFLELFPRSRLRPAVLLLFGNAAEEAAERLSREAARRLGAAGISAGAPTFSYFLNYSGLDRYNRLGIRFNFDERNGKFRYSGWAWREIQHRHPRSPEAAEASERLARAEAKTAHIQ